MVSASAGTRNELKPGQRVRVGIAGCGNIARPYAESLVGYEETELVGVTDLDPARAAALAESSGCRVYPDLDAMLADDDIDLIVNLTVHTAHHAVSTAALEAGKHVYSEKPLALSAEQARELVALAASRGLRLGCSPFTFMGAAQQAAWRAVQGGSLGTVRLAYAEVNWGRIESWHPAPQAFYEVGALFDVGVYPLTILTAFFGPARRVSAYGRVLQPQRRTKDGDEFTITTPDFVTAAIELESGVLARLTTDFYVSQHSKQTGIELHGDAASLHLASWQDPNSAVEVAPFGQPYQPLGDFSEAKMRWGTGVHDLARAILAGRPHRASGEHAAHVVEILCAATESLTYGRSVDIGSSFAPPVLDGIGAEA